MTINCSTLNIRWLQSLDAALTEVGEQRVGWEWLYSLAMKPIWMLMLVPTRHRHRQASGNHFRARWPGLAEKWEYRVPSRPNREFSRVPGWVEA
jgi:hypothetical protein